MIERLCCPESGLPLSWMLYDRAVELVGRPLVSRGPLPNTRGELVPAVGTTKDVLLRQDHQRAYPVVDGVPVVLVPEALHPEGASSEADLCDPLYSEAYEEMSFYTDEALSRIADVDHSEAFRSILPLTGLSKGELAYFPNPRSATIDALYDSHAQWDAYSYLTPMEGRTFLQLGGTGSHAVKFLLAGAAECWLVSPMEAEVRFAQSLAEEFGVGDRLHVVVSIGEELPFEPGVFEGVFIGGSLHHMQTELAFRDIARVLSDGGRLAAAEPWRAPLYSLGTKLLGKREPNAYCRPLTAQRVEPAKRYFGSGRIVHHGTFTRYALLALDKLGMHSSYETSWRIVHWDDLLADAFPPLRRSGSSVVILAEK